MAGIKTINKTGVNHNNGIIANNEKYNAKLNAMVKMYKCVEHVEKYFVSFSSFLDSNCINFLLFVFALSRSQCENDNAHRK